MTSELYYVEVDFTSIPTKTVIIRYMQIVIAQQTALTVKNNVKKKQPVIRS